MTAPLTPGRALIHPGISYTRQLVETNPTTRKRLITTDNPVVVWSIQRYLIARASTSKDGSKGRFLHREKMVLMGRPQQGVIKI